MSPRRITVSTVGSWPASGDSPADHPQVNLAISLHAADEDLRRRLVPVPSASLEAIVTATRAHVAATGRRVSIEYVLLAGVNDAAAQARRLAQRLRGLNCHVNLIPINASAGWSANARRDRRCCASRRRWRRAASARRCAWRKGATSPPPAVSCVAIGSGSRAERRPRLRPRRRPLPPPVPRLRLPRRPPRQLRPQGPLRPPGFRPPPPGAAR